MVDLEKLNEEIATLSATIKSLKAADPVNKDAITSAVDSLLKAKKTYAENNNGIGFDGQPYEEPLTKAQKKAKAKTDSQATVDSAEKQV
jgi:hypothetical protein